MVRITKLLLPLFMAASLLLAGDSRALLGKADELLRQGDKASLSKAYNTYKSAYLNALLDGDNDLADRAKNGVEAAASKLGIETEESDSDDAAVSEAVETKDTPSNIEALPRIVDYSISKNQLYITFDRPQDIKEINTFSLQEGKIKKVVFDFPGVYGKVLTHIPSTYFRDIRLAQNTPDTVRIVLEKGLGFYTKVDILGNKMVLSSFVGKAPESKIAPTATVIPKPPKEEPQIRALTPTQKRQKTVFVDAGHGGHDAGAVGYQRLMEKRIVLAVTQEVVKELKSRGYRVETSRDKDIFIPLRDRTALANKHNADLFLSIHANAMGKKTDVQGIEAYFLSPARSDRAKKVAALENSADLKEMSNLSQKTFLSFLNREKVIASNKFAIDIQKNILTQLKKEYKDIRDNGVREGPFWVLVGAQMPAVLLEIGYITNPTEARRMKTHRYQKLLAKGIADGIDSFFYYN